MSTVRRPAERPDDDEPSVQELARRQGVGPVTSLADMARNVFASDEELAEFLAHVAASRRANLA